MKLIDTHAHVFSEVYEKEDYNKVIIDSLKEIDGFINVGFSLETSKEVLSIAKNYSNKICWKY